MVAFLLKFEMRPAISIFILMFEIWAVSEIYFHTKGIGN